MMKNAALFKLPLLALAICCQSAQANSYIELSPAVMTVDAKKDSTHPKLVDFRLGYTGQYHQIELAVMTSIQDGELNQLKVEAPLVTSVLYHYIPHFNSSVKLHFIVGASQVNIKSSYPGTAGTDDDFSSLSFGLGLEEAFKSIPQLSLSLDWIQLYRGSDLNINAASLGVHYEF
jgi:hypothetical protein